LKTDFFTAIPSQDESALRLPDIFNLGPLGRYRMEEYIILRLKARFRRDGTKHGRVEQMAHFASVG
jgi:hypothetical protein